MVCGNHSVIVVEVYRSKKSRLEFLVVRNIALETEEVKIVSNS